ncbi:MAG: alpha/beta hydrolase [Flavobacteriaceae bacterium]|nr:alpha/beta hydrolase [Flavobacteriaceae bacterium]
MNIKTQLNFDKTAIKRIDKYPNRPTIVFLHDSLGCIDLWRDFPEKLGEMSRCNILVYDRQGYGKSCSFSYSERDNQYLEQEADILNDLLNYLNIDDIILFGHSDGGSIALITAAKYPKKIKGIITEGAHIFVEEITLKAINTVIGHYKETNLKSKLEKYHGEKTDDMFWAWASTWTTKEFEYWNIEGFLQDIKCPSLVIQGEDDEFGTLKQVEGIINGTKGYSEQLIIPNVRHTPHKEVPELILKKVSEFINEWLIE